MTRRPVELALYRAGAALAAPLAGAWLDLRARRGKEVPERLGERRGIAAAPRPAGALTWIHAASVGESLAALPLVERLSIRGRALVTTGTATSAAMMADRLPRGALHQFAPLDAPQFARRFLDHWRPDALLLVESELWPNLLAATAARGAPVAIVNARMSDRAFARWSRRPQVARAVLADVSAVLARGEIDAERFMALGAPRVAAVGNLKWDAPPLPVDGVALARLAGLTAGRTIWLAASTHAGEEEIAGAVHASIAARLPRALTLVVPRHPQRGPEIARALAERGLSVALRSRREAPGADVDVYVADTMGELGLFYRLAPVVFVGGTLVPRGGQNPLEAARLGAAV
ncbi:MAG: 3-deoxy-D-manno-octulosonic acid transferase, partial [Hyphomicrobiales bacterium]|nr:3-deoxy-D-manno-octulosonic acid transferase [Hyphomicrobiales bacterium]